MRRAGLIRKYTCFEEHVDNVEYSGLLAAYLDMLTAEQVYNPKTVTDTDRCDGRAETLGHLKAFLWQIVAFYLPCQSSYTNVTEIHT